MRRLPFLAAAIAVGFTASPASAYMVYVSNEKDNTVSVVESEASVGGGAFPGTRIPSVALAVGRDAPRVEERLRLGEPAVIGRIADGCLLLDVRTVQPDEEPSLAAALRAAMAA